MKVRHTEAVWLSSGVERAAGGSARRAPRAILTDLESCVLERDGSVGVEAWNVLQELARRAIPLCVITERSLVEVARLYEDFGLRGLAAFEGGAGLAVLPEGHVVHAHPAALTSAELLDLFLQLRRGAAGAPGALELRLVSELSHDEAAGLFGPLGISPFQALRHSLPFLCAPSARRALDEALAVHPEVTLHATASGALLLVGQHDGADLVSRMLARLPDGAGPILGLGSALHDYTLLTAADDAVIVPAEGGAGLLGSLVPGARFAPDAGGRGWARVVREALGPA
jgi:hypothetical protein